MIKNLIHHLTTALVFTMMLVATLHCARNVIHDLYEYKNIIEVNAEFYGKSENIDYTYEYEYVIDGEEYKYRTHNKDNNIIALKCEKYNHSKCYGKNDFVTDIKKDIAMLLGGIISTFIIWFYGYHIYGDIEEFARKIKPKRILYPLFWIVNLIVLLIAFGYTIYFIALFLYIVWGHAIIRESSLMMIELAFLICVDFDIMKIALKLILLFKQDKGIKKQKKKGL